MKTFWNWLLGVEQEFEHIVADFESVAGRLKALVTRKQAQAAALGEKIATDTAAKIQAEADAVKANTTANKLVALIS